MIPWLNRRTSGQLWLMVGTCAIGLGSAGTWLAYRFDEPAWLVLWAPVFALAMAS